MTTSAQMTLSANMLPLLAQNHTIREINVWMEFMYLTSPDITPLLSFNGPFTDNKELIKGEFTK